MVWGVEGLNSVSGGLQQMVKRASAGKEEVFAGMIADIISFLIN